LESRKKAEIYNVFVNELTDQPDMTLNKIAYDSSQKAIELAFPEKEIQQTILENVTT